MNIVVKRRRREKKTVPIPYETIAEFAKKWLAELKKGTDNE